MIWLDGRLVEPAAARIDPMDRGFLLADGLFETIRVAGGEAWRLDAHLARLFAGAEVLELPVPVAGRALADAMAEVIAANGLAEGSLRLTLTRGPGPRGLVPPERPRPTLLITWAPLAPPLPPARLVTAAVTRRNERSPLSRLKTLNYLDAVLARQEAARRGADDAVLLNTAGRVAEATAANLFAVVDGALLTPPVEDGALPGLRRAEVIERLGAEVRPIGPTELARATEVFLTTSLGTRAVVSLDGRQVGAGAPGSVALGLD